MRRLVLPLFGQTHIVMTNCEGSNLSGEIGNLFDVQEIYGGNYVARLSLLTTEETLLDGRVSIMAGRSSLASWGSRVRVRPIRDLYVQTGVYEVNQTLRPEDGWN